jgi:hypothetical protein
VAHLPHAALARSSFSVSFTAGAGSYGPGITNASLSPRAQTWGESVPSEPREQNLSRFLEREDQELRAVPLELVLETTASVLVLLGSHL